MVLLPYNYIHNLKYAISISYYNILLYYYFLTMH